MKKTISIVLVSLLIISLGAISALYYYSSHSRLRQQQERLKQRGDEYALLGGSYEPEYPKGYIITNTSIDSIKDQITELDRLITIKEQELILQNSLLEQEALRLEALIDRIISVHSPDLIKPTPEGHQPDTSLIIHNSALQESIGSYREYIDQFAASHQGIVDNPLWLQSDSELEALIESMTLDELVAQTMVIGVSGTSFDQSQQQIFSSLQPSGVILMGSNITNEAQTKTLIQDLQSSTRHAPMLVSVDQEGGVVTRLDWDTTAVYSQSEWKNFNDRELCQLAQSRGDTLHTSGFNLNYSPVTDLSNASPTAFINNRTISNQPNTVSRITTIYSECLEAEGVFATLKHYPGHGMVEGDSHIILPGNNLITRQDWVESHGIPFLADSPEFVMVGHLIIDQVDPETPTSQSSIWIEQILKNELGFDGLVITDDMKQYQNISGEALHEASYKSLQAGVDILLFVLSPEESATVHSRLTAMMSSPEDRALLEKKVLRILQAKRRIV